MSYKPKGGDLHGSRGINNFEEKQDFVCVIIIIVLLALVHHCCCVKVQVQPVSNTPIRRYDDLKREIRHNMKRVWACTLHLWAGGHHYAWLRHTCRRALPPPCRLVDTSQPLVQVNNNCALLLSSQLVWRTFKAKDYNSQDSHKLWVKCSLCSSRASAFKIMFEKPLWKPN